MNLSEVAEEVAARLDSIPGLNVFSYQPDDISPPAVWVENPERNNIEFDKTYGRGMDRMTLPVLLVVSHADNRSGQQNIRPYCDGSGPQSIKAVLETGSYTSLHTIRVTTAGVLGVEVAGVPYLAALFDLDITGQGG